MTARYVLAPEAASDLLQIWRYLNKHSGVTIADRVESVIRDKIIFLAKNPGAGHWRKDLTDQIVKFFPVYSYLIVYRPETRPLQVVSILHGRRVPFSADERNEEELLLVASGEMRLPKAPLKVADLLKIRTGRVAGNDGVEALLDEREESP